LTGYCALDTAPRRMRYPHSGPTQEKSRAFRDADKERVSAEAVTCRREMALLAECATGQKKNGPFDPLAGPIHHQLEHRIEAHIFVAFLAYCPHVTLRARLMCGSMANCPHSALPPASAHITCINAVDQNPTP
jgi:hypothetical protein